jgi:hypothetical protein
MVRLPASASARDVIAAHRSGFSAPTRTGVWMTPNARLGTICFSDRSIDTRIMQIRFRELKAR